MNIHEAIESLTQLIDHLNWIGVLIDEELTDANKALTAISEYVRINEGGTTND